MLSTRGRKDVDAKDVKVKVIVEAFDMLYLNGKVRKGTNSRPRVRVRVEVGVTLRHAVPNDEVRREATILDVVAARWVR